MQGCYFVNLAHDRKIHLSSPLNHKNGFFLQDLAFIGGFHLGLTLNTRVCATVPHPASVAYAPVFGATK